MSDDEQKARDCTREIAWRRFDLHAKQRIDVFKSYLTLSKRSPDERSDIRGHLKLLRHHRA
jgi:hypothetical protein